MQCKEVRSQFTDYVSNTLEEPGYLLVRQHLSGCESCHGEAEELKAIWANLGSIPSAGPGPELRARFEVMLDAYKQGLDHAPSSSSWQRLNSWIAGWWPQQPALQIGLALG